MSDFTISMGMDDSAAQAKVQKLKRDAQQAGRAFGNASSQAARIGGAAGGALGRGLGGFQQGMGAGALGLGLTIGGAAVNGFLARDAARVELSKSRMGRIQEVEADARQAIKQRDSTALTGGQAFAGKLRKLIAGGAQDSTLRMAQKNASEWGLSSDMGLDILSAAQDTHGTNPSDIAQLMATGSYGSAGEAAAAIKKSGSARNAWALEAQLTPEQADYSLERMRADPRMKNLGNFDSAANELQNHMMYLALSGESARVARAAAGDQMRPEVKLMVEAAQRASDTVRQLTAAAESQSTLAALLAEMGRVVGLSAGGAARQLTDFTAGNPVTE